MSARCFYSVDGNSCLLCVQENIELQRRDEAEWERVFQQLLHTLRTGVTLSIELGLLSEREREMFFVSGKSVLSHWRNAVH